MFCACDAQTTRTAEAARLQEGVKLCCSRCYLFQRPSKAAKQGGEMEKWRFERERERDWCWCAKYIMIYCAYVHEGDPVTGVMYAAALGGNTLGASQNACTHQNQNNGPLWPAVEFSLRAALTATAPSSLALCFAPLAG